MHDIPSNHYIVPAPQCAAGGALPQAIPCLAISAPFCDRAVVTTTGPVVLTTGLHLWSQRIGAIVGLAAFKQERWMLQNANARRTCFRIGLTIVRLRVCQFANPQPHFPCLIRGDFQLRMNGCSTRCELGASLGGDRRHRPASNVALHDSS